MADSDGDKTGGLSSRYQTLPLSKIDTDWVSGFVCDQWSKNDQNRQSFLQRREKWTQTWRDLRGQAKDGPWENSSNLHVPLPLIYGKAIHARLWQLFSDFDSLFGVASRNEVYEDREVPVKNFMTWLLSSYANDRTGTKDVFDEWLWDNVFDGSGFLKLYWGRTKHKYADVSPVTEVETVQIFDRENLQGVDQVVERTIEKEVMREEFVETPQIKRMLLEDIILPEGQNDPQLSDYVIHRVFFSSSSLKQYAKNGVFNEQSVEEALQSPGSVNGADRSSTIKKERNQIDGYDDNPINQNLHEVYEWYGKMYVEKQIDDIGTLDRDVDAEPQEVVVWVHKNSKKVLGWTYLYRIQPSGIRPIFKSDFIRFPDRSTGVGVPEVIYDLSVGVDQMYNMRIDNGTLASLQWGVYRSSATGFKPDTLRITPGTLYPVDNIDDVRMVNFPYLANFGYQEEDRIRGYIESVLTISDIQMGKTPSKVGALRNATGSNLIASESGIQLEIHFDRIARTLSKLFTATFQLARQRIPGNLYYRLTSDIGKPIFGKASREELAGDYDFLIFVDVLGQSRLEQQQQSVLMMQTLMNPAFTQTGVVKPDNLYAMAKNFLQKHRIRRIGQYISEPPDYKEFITTSDRIYKIVLGFIEGIADTIRFEENHEKAIREIEAFKESDKYGLLKEPEQITALESLIEKHTQLLSAQMAGGNPNVLGTQVPAGGFGADNLNTLSSPTGEPNGPVV